MHEHATSSLPVEVIVGAIAAAAIGWYVGAVWHTRHRGPWPAWRSVVWVLGVGVAVAAVAGPVAEAAHDSFPAHMVTHLLLAMLAPLCLVLAAPVTLALRSLPVVPARRLSALLRSRPVRFLVHPVTATVLNVGGLWVLYTTRLLQRMHDDPFLAAAITVHLLAAGYLFTASMIGVDPMPHRPSYRFRAAVLLVAFAAHGILAKFVVAHPPAGVSFAEAEAGGVLMYYGGDLIDAAILVILFARWYAAASPDARRRRGARAATAN